MRKIVVQMALVALAVAALLIVEAGGKRAVPVILDTDIGPDTDDAGSIALLHTLDRRGEARILAMMCNTTNPYGAPCLDAINTYYGRPDIPVGTLKGPGNPGGSASWQGGTFNRYIAEHYPNKFSTGEDAPDAVVVYRRALAHAPDRSVAIVSIGNTTNLRNLLCSEPDSISPLSGRDLVRRKVHLLSLMGGTYPKGPKEDPNLYGDVTASIEVLEKWPTAVIFSGVELGAKLMSGAVLDDKLAADNPVVVAYHKWDEHFWPLWDKNYKPGRIRQHSSYDQTSVLYAVRGARDYWTLSPDGHNQLSPDGSNEFSAGRRDSHRYLIEKMPREQLGRIIDELMSAEPGSAQSRKAR